MAKEIIIRDKQKYHQWSKRIEDWKKSGLSQKRFCKQYNLKLSTFGYWKHRIREQEKTDFVELSFKNLQPVPGSFELVIKDSIKIIISENFNEKLLKKLIRVLESDL